MSPALAAGFLTTGPLGKSFHYVLLHVIEYSSLCYMVAPCLFYIQEFVFADPKLLIYPSPIPSPLWYP